MSQTGFSSTRLPSSRGSEWVEESACLDLDPDLFFPKGRGRGAVQQFERAREVCHRCAVQSQCLRVAVTAGEGFGMWGGHTPSEREHLQRRLDRSSRQQPAAS